MKKVENGGIDLRTAEGAEALLRSFLPCAEANLVQEGYLAPVAFLIVTKHPETKQRLVRPIIIPTLLDVGDNARKEISMNVLRTFAKRLDAIGCLLLLESWIAKVHSLEEAVSGPLPSERADRKEVVTCVFEHQAFGTKLWTVDILRTSNGTPYLGDLEEGPNGGRLEGRMTGILPCGGLS